MASFTCPFCGCAVSISNNNHTEHRMTFYHINGGISSSSEFLKLDIYKCPNESCQQETVIATGINGYIENRKVNVYPEAIYKHFPDYIPEYIRQDYEEACLIRERSPKASATLARRCLQGMIRDFWGISGSSLANEISQLKETIHPAQWKAIDAMRQMGNIGAHMEKDTALIVDIDPDEAGLLLQLIERLMQDWYISRHDDDELYASITNINADLQQQRHPDQSSP